ncbi:MAG: acyl-CoA desaturase [Pseudomonadota bacterium]
MIALGAALSGVQLKWWYLPAGLGAAALSLFLCNMGIGPLHRIWQHKAGELKWPAQAIVMVNCALAMQGTIRDWVNYHSQHHRFADKPGDPHNPFESKRWAWVGWILFRDPKDMARPLPTWLKDNATVAFLDRRYNSISLIIHLVVPALAYLLTWAFGGPLALTAILHASVVLGRAVQFHATTLGINVLGHLKTPKWADHAMALLTGGEAFHDHHHDEPSSALHRPRRGLWNRIVDYNGTALLVFEKLGWAKDLKIAPQFR